MNYYERHLGDYARDTAHLSMLEHGAYGLLLDRYYATEAGIPADQVHRLARAKSPADRAAVDVVLAEFFTLSDGLWINSRADRELEKARTKIEAARRNGKTGGRPKKNPEGTQDKPTGLLLGSENETQQKALQTPDTSNQTPLKTKTPRKRAAAAQLVSVDNLVSEGVEPQCAADWLANRKAKGLPLTPTAWEQTKGEAIKAGLTIPAAIKAAAGNGWGGFKASWLAEDQSRHGRAAPATVPSTAADQTAEYLRLKADEAKHAVPPPANIRELVRKSVRLA